MKTRFAEIKPTEFLTLAIILILNAFFLKFNAFRGLNFFDISAFTDASWRVYSGQKPYVDFMFVSGPVHLYLNAFFFFLFGIGKNAFLALDLKERHFEYEAETVTKAIKMGMKLVQIPITYTKRVGGASGIRALRDGLNVCKSIAKVYFADLPAYSTLINKSFAKRRPRL